MTASLAFIYFCVPECKGKTLEQVDFLFNQGVALRDFGKADAAAMMVEAGMPSITVVGKGDNQAEKQSVAEKEHV